MSAHRVHHTPADSRPLPKRPTLLQRGVFLGLVLVLMGGLWGAVSAVELRTGQRLWPWSPYLGCGQSVPARLPPTVRVGLYEEFPNPWRLAKLEQVDFPVTLAIAAPSRSEFLQLRTEIQRAYPVVQEVYFWPLLPPEEGYYPGPWSDAAGVQRLAAEAADLPTVWDLEPPQGAMPWSWANWWANRQFMPRWLAERTTPVHLWRPLTTMGFDALFLRLLGLHYDPRDYSQVFLQVDFYTTGAGRPSAEVLRILRCGVERYGERFVPALGVLNDQEGPEEVFVPADTLRRYLQLARQAGVSEIWLFGVNGLNADYLAAIHETLPLAPLGDP